MKTWMKRLIVALVIVVAALAWVLHFHNASVTSMLPKWNWLQKSVAVFGAEKEAAEEDEEADTSKNEIPVHTAAIRTATLHRYVEGFGIISPRPPRIGQMAGSANIASPTAGVVSAVLCQAGQQVHAGDPLIQLDDRVAKSAEDQAQAALAQAEASLAALKATPRPDQLQIAELGVRKSQAAMELAQKNFDRVKQLAADQGASGKSLEQATNDLAAAKNDLQISEKQMALLKTSPTPEELAQENAKVAQATAALAAAKAQRQLLTIKSPIDATVVSLSVNPGESVDATRTIVQVVAVDRLMVDVDVPADQLPASAEGLSAEIIQSPKTFGPADTSEPIAGKVVFVSPQVDPKNGSVKLEIDLPANAALRPGLSVRVRIIAEEHKNCMAVPREAVIADENGDSVIALVEGNQATHKTVKTGLEENGLIEIIADGIKEGDKVVTAGAFGLPQATRVKLLD